MGEYSDRMIFLVNKSGDIYGDLKNEGLTPLEIELLAMLIGDCSKTMRTVKIMEQTKYGIP